MEPLKNFEEFLLEKKNEKPGISPAIYKQLEEYFKSASKPTKKGAQDHIRKTKEGWELSDSDFQEAKIRFKK